MLLYLTIFLASCTGLIGILVKTKEERKGSPVHRLTKGGWILISCLLLLLILNITIQYQKDRIQSLQEQNASNKRKADSLLQANQRQQLQLLLQQQVQKNNIDSFHYIVESGKTDNLLSTQLQALNDQRLNNAYLRLQLDKQQQVNNALTYKLDTLYLDAFVNMQLTPQWTEKLKPTRENHREDLMYGGYVSTYFLNACLEDARPLYDLIKNMSLIFLPQGNRLTYEFYPYNYMDTALTSMSFMRYRPVDMSLPSFCNLQYNYKTGELLVRIHKMKSEYYGGNFMASLYDFCKNDTESILHLYQDSTNKIVETASLYFATIYKNSGKYIRLDNPGKAEAHYGGYRNNGYWYSVYEVTQKGKASCTFE